MLQIKITSGEVHELQLMNDDDDHDVHSDVEPTFLFLQPNSSLQTKEMDINYRKNTMMNANLGMNGGGEFQDQGRVPFYSKKRCQRPLTFEC
ncbi:hypothetical protein AVEN_59252-1 [Araneus ventricosus]|uniref:Uncharacterized protein n=1 Tax=Araneus ventricosus TaxID=182803 RepID=A0A4Y2CZY8_ARAVE|nr:hypothetical protein AVEN_59252-1 [Araneus ventricosus]